tara:strand:- start:2658 stop:3302 length:645 start_codon:yes stop_codon:yes gene_type:complete
MTCEFSAPCHIQSVMPSLEAVCGKLFGHPGWVSKVIWGGALSFIPILNLFSLGYLLKYTIQLRQNKDWDLPEWNEMEPIPLLSGGLQVFLLLLAYSGCPIFIGWLASMLLDLLTFGFLGIVTFVPLAAGAFIAPFLFLSSMHVFVRDGLYSDAWKVKFVIEVARAMSPQLILPVIAFWGIILLALPLYGFSFFLGTWVLLAYSSAFNFSKLNQK